MANSYKIFTYSQKRPQKKNLALEDTEILDMIKQGKAPKNTFREDVLAN